MDSLKLVIKDIIDRINHLKKELVAAKIERSEMGHYTDCGSFYKEDVVDIEARIDELIRLKIRTEKFRKKIKHSPITQE